MGGAFGVGGAIGVGATLTAVAVLAATPMTALAAGIETVAVTRVEAIPVPVPGPQSGPLPKS
ncbi:hypothetical protein IPZ68_19565, partial [Streptomyces arenae]|nr:hypothetical protein [Streptomyces arenae]